MVIPKISHNIIEFMGRTRHLSLLLVLALFLQPAWAGEITNRLSFHLLVDDPPADELFKNGVDPSSVKFVREPILADTDFTGFDTTNHHFWTTPKTAMRLARKMELNTPFVLVALGKPIYVGVFSSPISSRSYGVPTVWAEPGLARADPTNNIIFKIRREPPPERSGEASKPDVRGDKRIVQAVKELGLPPSVPSSSMRYPQLNGVEED